MSRSPARGRPRMRLSAPEYSGVVFERSGVRLSVAPRGGVYVLQELDADSGKWIELLRGPLCFVRRFLCSIGNEYFEAAEGLPDDPLDTGLVPFDGKGRRYEARPARRARAERPARWSEAGELLRPARRGRDARVALPAGREFPSGRRG